MKTIEISKANASKAYQKASKEVKEVLEHLLGRENLIKGDITERVKTFEDACNEVGEDYDAFMQLIKGLSKDEAAYKMLKIIRNALNEGWTPDWNDPNQYKYYPWFDMRTGKGFGFSFSGYGGWGYAHDCRLPPLFQKFGAC